MGWDGAGRGTGGYNATGQQAEVHYTIAAEGHGIGAAKVQVVRGEGQEAQACGATEAPITSQGGRNAQEKADTKPEDRGAESVADFGVQAWGVSGAQTPWTRFPTLRIHCQEQIRCLVWKQPGGR